MGRKTAGWHQNFTRAPKAQRTDRDGTTFDSKTELQRHEYLKLLVRAGEVRNLQSQVPFELKIENTIVGEYTPDFIYHERLKTGEWQEVFEDVKGFHDKFSKFRIKVFEACYGVKVRIVKKENNRWIITP